MVKVCKKSLKTKLFHNILAKHAAILAKKD